MLTSAARRSLELTRDHLLDTVASMSELADVGWPSSAVAAQVRAGRWQRVGRAVVRHNAVPTRAELRRAALIILGPRAALTSFTALECWGLAGWEREAVHVLVPRGARVTRPPELDLRLHYCGRWDDDLVHPGKRAHRPGPAAVRAASGFSNPRSACGLLAAVVQQRIARPHTLANAIAGAPRTRHRALLKAAVADISQGAQALSEIDFARLCRRHGLPEPVRQAVRVEPNGRRRYLDAEWIRRDGKRVAAEVDGALHLIADRWWRDQLRQNEFVIAGEAMLRFPSVVMRCEELVVVDQLRRMLLV